MPHTFLTVGDVAEILRMSHSAVRLQVRQGKIPAVRISNPGKILIPARFIDDLLATAAGSPAGEDTYER